MVGNSGVLVFLAGNQKLKSRLGWVEAGLYVAGLALVAVFLYLRGDGERLRDEGIERFERELARSAALTRADDAQENESLPPVLPADAPGLAPVPAPDAELWDQRRITAYKESLETAGSPPLAVLNIDRLQLAVPVYDGTDEFNLTRGAGRIEGTARVDAEGNLGIAAHRDSFFRPLKDIEVGDRMELKTAGGTVTYAVASIEIVEPEDISVLAPTLERTLTLVTCYPFYYVGHAPKRFIVKATAEHSLAKTQVREI